MSSRLCKQVTVEQKQLNRLFDVYRPLVQKSAASQPDPVECSALAAMLHSFYTGAENIFKRIAVECDGRAPEGGTWHRALLDTMTSPGPNRPPVISTSLGESLEAYLQFRHVFRQAYSFELRWDKMADITLACEETWHRLQAELTAFLDALEQRD